MSPTTPTILRSAIRAEQFVADDDGVSPEKTAEILKVKVATLATWRSQGRGPKYRKPGRAVEYTPRFIRDFQRTRTFSPEPASARRRRRALIESKT